MLTEPAIQEYRDEIRKHVCSRCVERPPGGPPCAPLGKECGIEMYLPQLIDSIHEAKSWSIGPYLDHNRQKICQHCELLDKEVCSCPLHYLAVLTVEAVETVDERHRASGAASAPYTTPLWADGGDETGVPSTTAQKFGRRYPWETWFTEGRFMLVRGRDYTCWTYVMAQQVRNAAAALNNLRVSIKTAKDAESLTVTVLDR